MNHKFKVGDKVVYTNPFGVCWGVKTIISLEARTYDLWGDDKTVPTYHYDGTDTPWYSVGEENFKLADTEDLAANDPFDWVYFQAKHGFTPTIEQLGGCY